MNNSHKADVLFECLLKVVKDNWDCLKANPKYLAWCMMHYEIIHNVGRRMGECDNNPKYDIEWLEEWLDENKAKGDSSLLYDAWANCVSNEGSFYDPARDAIPGSEKLNKTMEDWVNICTSKKYKYQSIYQTRKSVYDHYLCTNGTGIGWNKDGYLDDAGPCETNGSLFYGYTMCEEEIPIKIRTQVQNLINDPHIKVNFDKYMANVHIHWYGNPAQKTILLDSWKYIQALKRECDSKNRACTKELIQKFKDEFERITYYGAVVERFANMSEEEKLKVKETGIYKDEDYEVDISGIKSFYSMRIFGFEMDVKDNLKKIDKHGIDVDLLDSGFFSPRYDVWSSFVYHLEVPEGKEDYFQELQDRNRQIFMRSKKEDKEEAKKIRTILDAHRPNRKHEKLINKASDGDKKAAAEMNKLCNYVEKTGYEALVCLAIKEEELNERINNLQKVTNKKSNDEEFDRDENYSTYYPMSPGYCRITEIPENAHESYFNATYEICLDILNHINEEVNTYHGKRYGNVKISLQFLKRQAKRFNLKPFNFRYKQDDKNVEEWKVLAKNICKKDGTKIITRE